MEGMQTEWEWVCAMLLRNSLQETLQQRQDASQANSASTWGVWEYMKRVVCVLGREEWGGEGGENYMHFQKELRAWEFLFEKEEKIEYREYKAGSAP